MTLMERSIAAERDILDRAFAYIRRNGSDSISAQLHAAAEVIAEQRAEIERLSVDAERYQFLRDNLGTTIAGRSLEYIIGADKFDASIDAARKEKP